MSFKLKVSQMGSRQTAVSQPHCVAPPAQVTGAQKDVYGLYGKAGLGELQALFFLHGIFDAIPVVIYLNPVNIIDSGSLFSSVELREIKILCICSNTKMTAM